MKILIVAFRFPPSNLIGAIRVGKLAHYLDRRGHEVRVLTTDIEEDRSLPLEIAREKVIYTQYRQRGDWVARLARLISRRHPGAPSGDAPAPPVSGDRANDGLLSTLRRHYYGLIHIPDLRADWMNTALPAGAQLLRKWRPDLLFASAPPFTGLILASRLSRRFGIPWVADFRDLWTDNPYYSFPAWRRPIDHIHERRTLRNASAIVTTSPFFAATLERIHHKRVETVLNGYAAEDFPAIGAENRIPGPLRILYTGSIYRGYRDPSPLFAAVAMLDGEVRRKIRIEFFGESNADIKGLAVRHGIADCIAVSPRVPYRTALELQLEADVLLLLHWNDKRDEGTVPAKLFEYLYARRPILYIGYEYGTAAELIKERDAGLVANTPERIRDQLRIWIEQKEVGRLGRLPPAASRGLSRDEQFLKLERLFADLLNERAAPVGV